MQGQGSVVGNDGVFSWLTQSAAATALWAALTGWLPYAVAAIPLIFYLIMIWETRTVVHMRNNWRQKRLAWRYAKLKAREKVTLAKIEAIELLRSARVEAHERIKVAESEAAKLVVEQNTAAHAPKQPTIPDLH